MHSIVIPSSSALLYCQSNPMLSFPCITAEKDAVSRCHNLGSSVPFCLLQSNDVTTLCSTGFQQGVDGPDTVNAVDRCCANVERAERELLQPIPRPSGFVFLADGLVSSPPDALRLSLNFTCFLPRFLPSFFPRVGCGTLTTPRLPHRRHFC